MHVNWGCLLKVPSGRAFTVCRRCYTGGEVKLLPIEKGNALIIKPVCLAIIPLCMLRYEELTDFLTQEPQIIGIKGTESDEEYKFKQVLRVRMWVPTQHTISWSIYSENREWISEEGNMGGCVIRYTKWDRRSDTSKYRNSNKNEQDLMLNDWPTLESKSIYLNKYQFGNIVQLLQKFDKVVLPGINLKKRKTATKPEWSDLEIMRIFEWGKIESVWNSDMMNKPIESFLEDFYKKLQYYLENEFEPIYQMRLDYNVPLETIKSIVYGN